MPDITVTAANVTPGSDAIRHTATAGATITAGQLLYKDAADGNKYKLADADASSAAATLIGIALNGASNGQPLEVQTAGSVNPGGTVAVGTIYVASGTAGGIAPSTDLATGDYTSIFGVGTATNAIDIQIHNSGALVPA